jgi:hypothetical protein
MLIAVPGLACESAAHFVPGCLPLEDFPMFVFLMRQIILPLFFVPATAFLTDRSS